MKLDAWLLTFAGRFAIARSSLPKQTRSWQRPFCATPSRQLEEQPYDEPVDVPAFGVDHDGQAFDAITTQWQLAQKAKELSSSVGAEIEPHYKHGDLLENPLRPDEITLELLLANQCHLGHHTSLWHPGNSRYIHGTWGEEKEAIHVISLDVIAAHLRRACKIVTGVAEKGGLILFVGTRHGQVLPVVQAAKMARGCHLFYRFKPGTFANGEQLLRNCKQKVINHLDEEMAGFGPQLTNRASIKPDLVVCLNTRENYVLLHECGMHNIPTIGIVDTDTNPTWVTYPIPANDDSLRSITLIAGTLGRAAEQGVATRLRRAKKGHVDFTPTAGLRMPAPHEVNAWHIANQASQRSLEKSTTADDESGKAVDA